MFVLDQGSVELVDCMGGDLSVVNAAKVSFHKQSEEMGLSEKKLIAYLMGHRHGSPFEHAVFTFRVKAPIFVAREWMRHRIGSFNEVSGRYVEFKPEFYIPLHWRIPAASNKQGSVFPDPEGCDHDLAWESKAYMFYEGSISESYAQYTALLDMGVAKEMARMVLPLSLYTEFIWTVNARSLMNFLSLRTGPDAQWEIRQYALEVERLFAEFMPDTHAAWESNGWIAP
jgi:thymidylate synthase (FAD)